MTADALLILTTQILYLFIAASTLLNWLRQRNQTQLDIALVFLALALAIVGQYVPALGTLLLVAYFAHPYLLLRVARYFQPVPRWVFWSAAIGFVVVCISIPFALLAPTSTPAYVIFIYIISYFFVFEGYAAYLFIKGARSVGGLTAKRLRLAAIGSGFLAFVFLVALLVILVNLVIPVESETETSIVTAVLQVLAILAGLSYYLGFAPPQWLRRAWQFEELHKFVQQNSSKPVADPQTAFAQLTQAAQRTVGGTAVVAAWQSTTQHLNLDAPGNPALHLEALESEPGLVVETWQAKQAREVHPLVGLGAQLTRWTDSLEARSLFAVPIVSTQREWGLLLVALPYVPLFIADDLELLNLLANQSAASIDYTALIGDLQALNQSLEKGVADSTAALRESERQYRNLVDNALVGVFRSKVNGDILYLNRKSLQDFGYDTIEQIIYEHGLAHYRRPEDRERFLQHLKTDGHVNGMEVEMLTRKGEARTFLISASITGDLLEGMTVDITERKRAEQFILRQADRAQAVAEVSRALTSARLDYQGVLDAAAQRIAEMVGDACVIRMLSEDGLWLNPVAAHHVDASQMALLVELFASAPMESKSGLPSRVVESGRAMLMPSVTFDQLKIVTKPEYWPYLEQMNISSVMIAPLYEGDHIIGTVSLTRHQLNKPYTVDDQTLLVDLVDRVMLALINARLYANVQRELAERKLAQAKIEERGQRDQALAELSGALAAAEMDLQTVLAITAKRLSEVSGDLCLIFILSPDQQSFAAHYIYHPSSEAVALFNEIASQTVKVSEGFSGRVIETGEPLLLPKVDPQQFKARLSPRFWPLIDRFGAQSLMTVALRAPGQVLGVISMIRYQADHPHTESDLAFVQDLADRVGLSIVNVRLYEAAQHEIAERKASQAALRLSEERFSKAFRASPAAVTITRLSDGIFVEVNDVFLKLMGYSLDEVLGRRSVELDMFANVDERTRMVQKLRDEGSVHSQEMVMRTHTGAFINVLFSTEMIELNGEIHALAILFDITQRKEAEVQLQKTMAKLEINNRELQDFAYVASHDLQEPLRKIQAFGDRLKKQTVEQLDDKSRDYLERMQSAAARMQALINDLLTFSRVTTKAQPFVPTDLNLVLKGVMSDLEIRLERSGGQVEIGVLPTIEADLTQMRQVLQNLISNALKFSKPDVAPVVKISAECQGNLCIIQVADNGIGFDEKYLDRIFTPFQRLHGRGEYEGTGIGLSVVRKIVERHGGQVTAHSRPDEGATFIVTLPIKHITESI